MVPESTPLCKGARLGRIRAQMRLLVVDNYDSFTWNLVQLFSVLGVEVIVRRNDAVSRAEIEALEPRWICISPGPRDPAHAGISRAVIREFAPRVPILGVCLGMQAINEVFGGRTIRAPIPVHGKRHEVFHDGTGIFAGLPSPFPAARYHSLCVSIRSPALTVCARCADGVVMGIRHETWRVFGVQFHPESFLSEHGPDLAANFLSVDPSWKRPA
jgi:anthranilate synthase component 2